MLNFLRSLPLRAAMGLAGMGMKVTRIEDMFGGLLLRGLEISKFANYSDYLKVGSRKVWATFKACDAIGKVVTDTPCQLVRKRGDGTPVEGGPIYDLLANPNPFETLAEMFYKLVFHIKLTGNAYWAKDQPNDAGDRPRAIYSLNPKNVRISIDPRVGIIGYIYRVGGMDIPYNVEEVIHFRNPHPDNDFYGLGEIEAGEDLFNEFINRENWSRQFWKNGASPSGVLMCEDNITDKAKFEEAKAKWKQEFGGPNNAGKTVWLTGKWKYEQLGLSMAEMQNVESSQYNVENIFHMHGVPLSVAGIKEAANYATAQVDDLIFRRYTVKPLCKLISDTLQSDLVDGFDNRLQIMFALAGLTDMTSVVANYVPLFDRGIVSVNELRELAGLKKIEDPQYDQHFITAGLVPFELAGVADQGQTDQAAQRAVQRFIEATLVNNRETQKALHELTTTARLQLRATDELANRPEPQPLPPAPVNVTVAQPEVNVDIRHAPTGRTKIEKTFKHTHDENGKLTETKLTEITKKD